MDERIRSSTNTPRPASQNRSYETTYQRGFPLKRSSSITQDVPFGQRFLVGAPYDLEGPVGVSLYTMDYSNGKQGPRAFFRPDTRRANRPHPHQGFPYWPRRAESLCDLSAEETGQVLKNQISSTYQVDFNGAAQGFPLMLAYARARPYWRERARYTLDSEYRSSYQDLSKEVPTASGRYGFSPRTPADAIVPQTLPLWKKKSLQSIYTQEICEKAPTDVYMKEFVDSLYGPME